MRSLSPELKSHLAGAATTLCWLWRISLKDGRVFGFTDHDHDLEFEGTSFEAGSGLSASERDHQLGFATDNGAVRGILDSDKITSADIHSGAYEDAVIDSFRVNWNDLSQAVHMASGRLGAISESGAGFEAEWVGHSVLLERSVGRVFSSLCDAEFGDARCGLNASDFPEGTICPRTAAACRAQFDNIMNYRGFPYLLGDDALQAAPQLGERRDGSSRYR